MRSLLDLISKHTDANAIIPVIAIASIIFTIVVYLLLKPKWMKYAIHGVLFFVGGIMFLKGYFDMLQPSGLSLILFSTKVLVFSIIGILFSAILDTLDSLLGSFKKNDQNTE